MKIIVDDCLPSAHPPTFTTTITIIAVQQLFATAKNKKTSFMMMVVWRMKEHK